MVSHEDIVNIILIENLLSKGARPDFNLFINK